MKWIECAENFPSESKSKFEVLNGLNEELTVKSVLLGNGLTPSEADVVVFSVLHSFVVGLSESNRQKFAHVMRWMDWILNQKPQTAAKVETDSNAVQNAKQTTNSEAETTSKKSAAVKKTTGKDEVVQGNEKLSVNEPVEKEVEVSVSLLNIQVGLIRKAWKHPSADSLLVEEIDIGEPKLRQVVSGLAKYCSPDELTNRHVVLITNVKTGKLRDVMSEGRVLCASNEDHTLVEPLIPPEGVKLGERVSFSGNDGSPEELLKLLPFNELNFMGGLRNFGFYTNFEWIIAWSNLHPKVFPWDDSKVEDVNNSISSAIS